MIAITSFCISACTENRAKSECSTLLSTPTSINKLLANPLCFDDKYVGVKGWISFEPGIEWVIYSSLDSANLKDVGQAIILESFDADLIPSDSPQPAIAYFTYSLLNTSVGEVKVELIIDNLEG
ncbi:MAG: hypothetical protein ACSHX3_01890 [Litorimonas sp.]